MKAMEDSQYSEQLHFLLAFTEGRIISSANKARPYRECKIPSIHLFDRSCKSVAISINQKEVHMQVGKM